MSKDQYTPRQKFKRYLAIMIHWRALPRGSEEREKAIAGWLARGQHMGGKLRKAASGTDEGQRIKGKRDRWRFGWREKIAADPELLEAADKAGVLQPGPDTRAGDFASPDPRVYSLVTFDDPPKKEEAPPSVTTLVKGWPRR